MPNVKLKNYLHLHVIVFIWGFTAIFGKLISLDALPLVWYRMFLATIFIGLFIVINRKSFSFPKQKVSTLILARIVIAAHWYTFYQAIKVSNISITLVCLATGAFFASILEPIFNKRKIIPYEIIFGLITVLGIGLIFKVESQHALGILLAVTSAFLSALFSVINGKLAKEYDPNAISFWELLIGVVTISFVLFFTNKFDATLFTISLSDFLWLLLLASVCTAYAFTASVKVMKYISPFTVMLTINLEPIYGIILALLFFSETENMNSYFYLGAAVIFLTVVANGILKNRKKKVKPEYDIKTKE